MLGTSCQDKSNDFTLSLIDASYFNRWQKDRHYLKRPIIRSKLLAHGIYVDGELVGGLLWATPHFTKKSGLFGYEGLPDKWEVLMLARFYLEDGCGVIASSALSESIGKSNGKGSRKGTKRRGWRLQQDWCTVHPPKFPENPFVPRLLISWSDMAWNHEGIIYKSSGWDFFDLTYNSSRRHGGKEDKTLYKKLWIMKLPDNFVAYDLGIESYRKKYNASFDSNAVLQ